MAIDLSEVLVVGVSTRALNSIRNYVPSGKVPYNSNSVLRNKYMLYLELLSVS